MELNIMRLLDAAYIKMDFSSKYHVCQLWISRFQRAGYQGYKELDFKVTVDWMSWLQGVGYYVDEELDIKVTESSISWFQIHCGANPRIFRDATDSNLTVTIIRDRYQCYTELDRKASDSWVLWLQRARYQG
jgi:hypothetical protein